MFPLCSPVHMFTCCQVWMQLVLSLETWWSNRKETDNTGSRLVWKQLFRFQDLHPGVDKEVEKMPTRKWARRWTRRWTRKWARRWTRGQLRSWAKKEARRDHVWNQLLIADFASTGHERPNGATVQIRFAINLSDLKSLQLKIANCVVTTFKETIAAFISENRWRYTIRRTGTSR